eukprot:9764412-Lingulodinium_polyedra.AAC.1
MVPPAREVWLFSGVAPSSPPKPAVVPPAREAWFSGAVGVAVLSAGAAWLFVRAKPSFHPSLQWS